MAAAMGKRLYGQVDRVPGHFYVSTMFWWINGVPIAPDQTWLVFEGSERRGAFRGKPIPFVGKSIMMGYLRGWLGAGTVILSCVAGFSVPLEWMMVTLVPSAVAGACLVWFIMNHQNWRAVFIPAGLLALSVALWAGWLELGSKLHDAVFYYVLANLTATLAAFTRLFTPATYERALQLADELGIDSQPIEDSFRKSESTKNSQVSNDESGCFSQDRSSNASA
jgi:hypothetical protein